jgi:hypothetical protein
MLAIRTKNTFIEVEKDDSTFSPHSRPRLNSCPAIMDALSTFCDSVSTVDSCDRSQHGQYEDDCKTPMDSLPTHYMVSSPASAMNIFHLTHGEAVAGSDMNASFCRSGSPMNLKNCTWAPNQAFASSFRDPQLNSRRGGSNSKKVFIGGLRHTTSAAMLRSYFSRFGRIKSCGIVIDADGRSKRFGYCEFQSEAAVFKLLLVSKHVLDGISVSIRPYFLRE